MSDEPSTKTKPAIWKRWWFWAVIIIALTIWAQNGDASTNPDGPDKSVTASPAVTPSDGTPQGEEEAEPEPETTAPHERFAEAYGTPIGNLTTFDPQDRDSGHYRTEYRLGAYAASKGAAGGVGDMTIDMIEYGGYGDAEKNTSFRVYLTGPKSSVIAAYPAMAKAMDPSLSDDDINAALARLEDTPGAILTDALASAESAKAIRNDTLSRTGDQAEAYLDADTTKWD